MLHIQILRQLTEEPPLHVLMSFAFYVVHYIRHTLVATSVFNMAYCTPVICTQVPACDEWPRGGSLHFESTSIQCVTLWAMIGLVLWGEALSVADVLSVLSTALLPVVMLVLSVVLSVLVVLSGVFLSVSFDLAALLNKTKCFPFVLPMVLHLLDISEFFERI